MKMLLMHWNLSRTKQHVIWTGKLSFHARSMTSVIMYIDIVTITSIYIANYIHTMHTQTKSNAIKFGDLVTTTSAL